MPNSGKINTLEIICALSEEMASLKQAPMASGGPV